jgi:hypothetical protein
MKAVLIILLLLLGGCYGRHYSDVRCHLPFASITGEDGDCLYNVDGTGEERG